MKRLLLLALLPVALTACISYPPDTYPIMPDLSKYTTYDQRYNRMFKWGKDSCDDQAALDQLAQDYYPDRDLGSVRKGEAAEALSTWIDYNRYDEMSPDGLLTLKQGVYAGCLTADKLWS